MILSVGPSITNAGCNSRRRAMSHTAQGSMVRNDAIVALGGIIWSVGKRGPRQSRYFSLKDGQKCRIHGRLSRTCAIRTTIDRLRRFRVSHHAAEPKTEKSSEISFIEVDYTKAMKLEVVVFFGNHGGNDFVPLAEQVASGNAEVEKR